MSGMLLGVKVLRPTIMNRILLIDHEDFYKFTVGKVFMRVFKIKLTHISSIWNVFSRRMLSVICVLSPRRRA